MMGAHLSPNFFIKTINIHSVEGASCVNLGNNEPTGFTSYKKHNQGFGSVSGDSNTIDGIKTLLNDKALMDMFHDSDPEDLSQIRDLITSKIIEYLEEEDEEDVDEDETEEVEAGSDHEQSLPDSNHTNESKGSNSQDEGGFAELNIEKDDDSNERNEKDEDMNDITAKIRQNPPHSHLWGDITDSVFNLNQHNDKNNTDIQVKHSDKDRE